jgi:ribonucleoside-diphosphate reductase beta chain
MISPDIFNVDNDYLTINKSLFLQGKKGLIDSIHKNHPSIWALYKKMKSLDWDENEFNFSKCVDDFKTCSPTTYDVMIKTLAWQWEADSIACHNLIPIVAPFVSSSELWCLWSSIALNECLHALTYSEIVRNSFENPDDVLESVIKETEAIKRLESVSNVLSNVYNVSHRLSLGQLNQDDQEAYDAIFMFVVTLLILERIQFMGSFAITFAIADTGLFLAIGKAVQKICIDELQVHVKASKEILRIELSTERGLDSYNRNIDKVRGLLREVVSSELTWTDYILNGQSQLPGVNNELIKDWVLFNANDVYDFLSIPNEFKVVSKNNLGYMNDWVDINKNQASAQEEKVGNYLIGGFKNNTDDKIFDLDF